jgi:hypothetical protein
MNLVEIPPNPVHLKDVAKIKNPFQARHTEIDILALNKIRCDPEKDLRVTVGTLSK